MTLFPLYASQYSYVLHHEFLSSRQLFIGLHCIRSRYVLVSVCSCAIRGTNQYFASLCLPYALGAIGFLLGLGPVVHLNTPFVFLSARVLGRVPSYDPGVGNSSRPHAPVAAASCMRGATTLPFLYRVFAFLWGCDLSPPLFSLPRCQSFIFTFSIVFDSSPPNSAHRPPSKHPAGPRRIDTGDGDFTTLQPPLSHPDSPS